MNKICLIIVPLLVVTVATTSCRKKEQPPPPPAQGMGGQPGAVHGPMGDSPDKKVVVPENVKGAWKAVKIEVELKAAKSAKQYSLPLNAESPIPGSDLTLKVGDFLPHFSMTADSITSISGNPENPAVQVEVLEKGKVIFKGWLFAKFPEVHPLVHEKYGLKLLGGEKK